VKYPWIKTMHQDAQRESEGDLGGQRGQHARLQSRAHELGKYAAIREAMQPSLAGEPSPDRPEEAQPLGFAGTWVRITASFVLVASGAVVYLLLSLVLMPWRPLRIRIGNVYGKTFGPSVARILGGT
jgi:hypothetical protein